MRALYVPFLVFVASCGANPPADAPPSPPNPARLGRDVASEGATADLARVAAFDAGRPEYERHLDLSTAVPVGVASLSSAACATCHAEIAAEWAQSTHAHAWTDRQFQAEIAKSDNRWLCINCHTPLPAQQDKWAVAVRDGDVEAPDLVVNGSFDPALRDEGITCAACHVRDGVIHGPGLEGALKAHPVIADPAYRNGDLCLRCHQAVATYPGKTFVCTFNTGEEWRAGAAVLDGQGCADCHMRPIERPAGLGGAVRTVRMHGWRGAGIPKEPGVQPPVATNPPGLGLAARWEAGALIVDMTNANAGHRLPTGDPERWVAVDVRFEDAAGAPIGEAWTTRIGQIWEWWPAPKQLSDNRLAPREVRTASIAVPTGAVQAIVEASSHRMSEETQAFHHLDGYPLAITTHRLIVTPSGVEGGVVAQ